MTRQHIINLIRANIDEINSHEGVEEIGDVFAVIDRQLEASANEMLRKAPLWLCQAREVPLSGHIPGTDGSGKITRPVDYLRLHSFKMGDWKQVVTKEHSDESVVAKLQGNRCLRGKPSRPVVVVGKDDLEYYTTRQDPHVVERANYVPMVGATDPYAPVHGNAFIWNGKEYKVVVVDGLAWLDRNIGANRVAISHQDPSAFGDYYQWGRATDGHEKKFSDTTNVLSSTITPSHDKFITTDVEPHDWLTNKNDKLWEGAHGANNPGPYGWRLPTVGEWTSLGVTIPANAFSHVLKLPSAGYKDHTDGLIKNTALNGHYHAAGVNGIFSRNFYWYDEDSGDGSTYRAFGSSLRLVRDIMEDFAYFTDAMVEGLVLQSTVNFYITTQRPDLASAQMTRLQEFLTINAR